MKEPLPQDAPDNQIERVADRLEKMSYSPVLLIPTPGFLRMKAKEIEQESERVRALSAEELVQAGMPANEDAEAYKANHLRLLDYHYRLLARLRLDEPEAWDEVNELYEDD